MRYLYILGILLGLYSCAEKQNFDQYEDLNVTPTIEGSILYVEVPEYLINASQSYYFYTREFNFDAFNEDFFAERVLSGVVTYEVVNTTSKPMELVAEFLDGNGTILDTESFSIEAAPAPIFRREITYGPAGRSIEIIKNMSSIRVSAQNLGDDTSVSTIPDPKVIVRSSGAFVIEVR
ncbi:MAG: hypothetical protein V7724_00295 [Sediminicola sp.]|tara:strand:+ start:99508 stop:100041 length:534 start_codon:yes stop_codon:yes gene_type:complete